MRLNASISNIVADAFRRDHFTCIYCGFDGRTFDSWMQLSIDHVRPRSSGGNEDDPANLAVACRACNCITSRMKFAPDVTRDEIIRQKRVFVANSRKGAYEQWMKTVAPSYLDRPLPNINELPILAQLPPAAAASSSESH